jgi:hypothetical protein
LKAQLPHSRCFIAGDAPRRAANTKAQTARQAQVVLQSACQDTAATAILVITIKNRHHNEISEMKKALEPALPGTLDPKYFPSVR